MPPQPGQYSTATRVFQGIPWYSSDMIARDKVERTHTRLPVMPYSYGMSVNICRLGRAAAFGLPTNGVSSSSSEFEEDRNGGPQTPMLVGPTAVRDAPPPPPPP